MSTSDPGPQSATHAQLTMPSWHPGEDLTRLEEEMKDKAAAGGLVDHGGGPFGLDDMQGWGEERAIRAAVLRYLLAVDKWPVDTRGVRLRSVRIHGHLDLEGVALRCALRLADCYLDARKPVCLDHATASRLALTRCRLAGLTGEMLSAREVELTDSTLTGPLQVPGADITGQLSCGGAKLTGSDNHGNALVGDGMKVGGDVFLDREFTAAGAIRLSGADITGQLSCRGAKLTGRNNDGNALVADRMKVGGSVFFDEEFTAAGAIRLLGADITGQLSCGGAKLTGKDNDGNALVGDRMKVGGSVFLGHKFTAAGTIRLPGADITGQLSCRGAKLTGQDNDALVCDGMKVGGDVFLGRVFIAAGRISVRSVRVGGSVELLPAALAGPGKVALDAAGAQITGSLVWAPTRQVGGRVNLEGATVGHLVDRWDRGRSGAFWPAGGQLRLDGFTYDRLGGDRQATVAQRLEWIRSQYQRSDAGWRGYVTQPYEQLAKVYRQEGKDSDARKVAIARRVDLRRYGRLSWYLKAGNWLMDKTIKYGYQTWRAAAGLAVVYAAFLVMSWVAQHHHAVVPVSDLVVGVHPPPVVTQCTPKYPCFYPLGYAVDVVIPVINVHQADFWGLNGWGWVAGSWAATGLGWAAVTLLAVGYTGLVRQQ